MTNDMPDNPPARPAARRLPLLLSAIAAGAIVGYGIVTQWNAMQQKAGGDPDCAPAMTVAKKVAPLATGEVAALTMVQKPMKMPDLAFEDGQGNLKKLSDWRGKTVLLNLWATWCVPCRKEMPALERLEAKLGGDKFQVVAVNIDTRDLEKPKAFLKDANLTHLGNFSDAKAKVFQDLKSIGLALGMPTSVLIDGKGCQIGNMAGPAEWDSEDAIKLIQATIAQ
ncbi:MAG: TlpA family protein disulfide reductase [Rhizobiales bacterium]|nr:TlpA family protein disulfide reductase [Hyphomicrobiales bacterium]